MAGAPSSGPGMADDDDDRPVVALEIGPLNPQDGDEATPPPSPPPSEGEEGPVAGGQRVRLQDDVARAAGRGEGMKEGGGRRHHSLGQSQSSVTEEYGSLARRGKGREDGGGRAPATSSPHHRQDSKALARSSSLKPPSSQQQQHHRAASSPATATTAITSSITTSFVNKLLGEASPFSESRQARARLSRFRAVLQSEVARINASILRSKKAVRAFEEQSRAEERQLVRMGLRRHLGLHTYYSSVKRTLLQLECEQQKHILRVLETRENEIALLSQNLKEIMAGGQQLDEAFFRSPAELASSDMFVRSLRKRMQYLTRICNQVRHEVTRQTLRLSHSLDGDSVEERRRKLLHIAEECRILYFGGSSDESNGFLPHEEVRWQEEEDNEKEEGEGSNRSSGTGEEQEQQAGGGDEPGRDGSSGPSSSSPLAARSVLPRRRRKRPQFQRQRDVLQLRMKWEQEFSNLMEDERYREGRLLRRWFELLEGQKASTADEQLATGAAEEAELLGGSSSRRRLSVSSSGAGGGNGGGGYPVQHAPRSIVAFTNYFAVKRIMEPYRMDESLRPSLIGLTQSLIFRRARPVVFGYVNSSMKSLNHRWRARIRHARHLSARAIGVPDAYLPDEEEGEEDSKPPPPHADEEQQEQEREEEETGGRRSSMADDPARPKRKDKRRRRPYEETAAALSEMTICLTPQEMADCLMAAMRCLHYEAVIISGNPRPLDADTMFPLLLWCLVHADLPDMYSCLYCLRNFATGDHAGEKAYYITCLEAAVQHLDRMPLPASTTDAAASTTDGDDSDTEGCILDLSSAVGKMPAARSESTDGRTESNDDGGGWDGGYSEDELGPSFSKEEQQRAMAFLDQWLGVEAAMEETIDVLEADGWF